ncbi:MAG TPA: sulfite exporter TauE/SafE family protein [Phenylobacterium sp.]|uniref:sulfite exporter TauE/SafE family protein n=1 Tax=Phenylobacterium sp. TaxID=1871053 RepID=UPI002B495D72|nr:sulfite exporter TauE/SafE family protein [Phenylobacterium sp.]HKR88020.1 sulfite exporter TauE/SafE family protein [Phenylobacterium sp.]
MHLLDHINPLYTLSGLVVGFLVGLTGVGGGSLMTPLLVLVFGIHPTTAVGTDLLYAAATKTVGTGVHGFKGTVQWKIVGRLAAGSVPATILTLWLLHQHKGPAAGSLITITLGWALLVTALAVLFRKTIVKALASRAMELGEGQVAALTILLGAALGTLVSLTSVGAGALGMTVLLILYPRTDIARLVGSDIAHAVPLTLIAGLGHWMMGSVDWILLVSLLSGSVPGIILGSVLAARTPDGVLRPVLASVLVLVGVKLLT